jgi:biopolymer transport protein ExbD
MLENIFREREVNFIIRKNSNEIEKTVFIRAENSLKVSEVAKVIKALEVSGASPLLLPFEFEIIEEALSFEEFKKSANTNVNASPVRPQKPNSFALPPKPNPLLLFVSIGNPVPRMPAADADGIMLQLSETHVSRTELVPPTIFEVEIRKDDEYLIEGKTVAKGALEKTLADFIKDFWQKDMRVITVYLNNNADEVSFGSVAEVGEMAFRAGFKELQLTIYVPEKDR